jgi:hypothetical protein
VGDIELYGEGVRQAWDEWYLRYCAMGGVYVGKSA